MSAEVVRINQEEECTVVKFPVKEDIILTRFGVPKKTRSNSYKGQGRMVYPFKTQKELQDMINYFLDKNQYVYYLLFVVGINMARRIGDTLELRWKNFYFPNGRIRTRIEEISEEKTDKLASPYINEAVIKAIKYYVEMTGVDPSDNDYQGYIFKGLVKGTHISDEAYRVNLKLAAEACGIKQNIASHSTRKTFGYWTRQLHPQDNDSMILLRQIYNHSSTTTTETYIGLTDEKVEKYYNDMGDFFSNYVMDNKEFVTKSSENAITIDQNTLRDIIKMVYQDGANNASITDYNVHMNAIEAAMEIVMDSTT